ncbi:hypothetical protein A2870_02745 [Candidatus Curtissbacteria bacterium RIFCSPHIGHO2_01_FULL_41_11]|uniref:UspA domain-containing protein n=1 Tax=Candidatus Curtissbacteria bacterium RIFCSPHIGHO2_01_FULL_41_11 TaxID=1797711 RepID=A0A1F5G4J2_9BACT|nr:MAG: hypothetical protein A2870_02745 [Candidatus Curtissbacteria bacterium RIFCSPHIGHO2_01_FULL_41_11]
MADRKLAFPNPLHHEKELHAIKILVPINGADSGLYPSSLEALKIACEMAHSYRHSEIALVHVSVVPRNKQIPGHSIEGNKLLDYAREIVEKQHVVVGGCMLPARSEGIAHAILGEAKVVNAGLIVIGTSGKDKFNGHQLNPVAKSIMDHSTCEVVLVRSPLT